MCVPEGLGSHIPRQSVYEIVKVDSPTYRPSLSLRYSILLQAEPTQGHSAAGRIVSMENQIDTKGNQTRFLPNCSTEPW